MRQLRKMGIDVSPGEEFLLEGFASLHGLLAAGAEMERKDGMIYIHVGGISNIVETKNDLFILEEIHRQGIYNFWLEGPCVVVDIGMHVGFAALFFAAKNEVARVYGYEPFSRTFAQAEKNLAANPGLAKKILPQRFGISDRMEEVEYAYHYAHKGDAGHFGLSETARRKPGATREKVQLKSAIEVIRGICQEHTEEKIVLKLDCEGCEYPMLHSLKEEGIPEEIMLIMLEWHAKGGVDLLDTLHRSGFRTITRNPFDANNGLIYALR